MLWVYVLVILLAGSFNVQHFTSNWQRRLVLPLGKPRRIVLQYTRDQSHPKGDVLQHRSGCREIPA
jgi:hypothetical protein